jgi:Helix-turn-helix family
MDHTLDARSAAVAAKAPIGDLGGSWMTGPEEEAATVAAGMDGWQLYFLARHGVLGDVDPDVVTAAAFFFPADVVRSEWLAAREVMTPGTAVERYLELCHAWGRTRLAGFPAAGRLADLAQRVVDGADVAGLPLFAGWRALPVPKDAPARCAHLMQLLREHRGSCHGVAVVASGMAPLMAVLANQGGEENAREYGWQPPFPTVTDADRALRHRVEEMTDDLVAPAYEGLDRDELAELLDLLLAAHEHGLPGRGATPGG